MISTHLTVSAFGGRYNYLHRGLDTFILGVILVGSTGLYGAVMSHAHGKNMRRLCDKRRLCNVGNMIYLKFLGYKSPSFGPPIFLSLGPKPPSSQRFGVVPLRDCCVLRPQYLCNQLYQTSNQPLSTTNIFSLTPINTIPRFPPEIFKISPIGKISL